MRVFTTSLAVLEYIIRCSLAHLLSSRLQGPTWNLTAWLCAATGTRHYHTRIWVIPNYSARPTQCTVVYVYCDCIRFRRQDIRWQNRMVKNQTIQRITNNSWNPLYTVCSSLWLSSFLYIVDVYQCACGHIYIHNCWVLFKSWICCTCVEPPSHYPNRHNRECAEMCLTHVSQGLEGASVSS